MSNKFTAVLGAMGLGLALSGAAHAAPAPVTNLVTNGGFEDLTNGGGQLHSGYTEATGWSTNGYNFVFTPGSADSTGVNGVDGNLQLWGPGNGSNNGLIASPDGGNFLAADGAYGVDPITQTINGLTPGQKYNVSFYWAGAQQEGFTGDTTEQWQVKLGSAEQDTAVLNNANHGFTGWQHETFTYTATNTSEVLSFLANGTPNGEPPFSLLDGVRVTAAPEASSYASVFAGMAFIGLFMFRRSKAKKSAA